MVCDFQKIRCQTLTLLRSLDIHNLSYGSIYVDDNGYLMQPALISHTFGHESKPIRVLGVFSSIKLISVCPATSYYPTTPTHGLKL